MPLNYSKIMPLTPIDDLSLNEAYKIFNTYKKEKIIVTNDWDSNIWYMTDEYTTVKIDFNIDTKNQKIFKLNINEYINYIKAYVCYLLGYMCLTSIRNVVHGIKKISITDNFEDIYIDRVYRIEEFLSLLPSNDKKIELVFDLLDAIEDTDLLKGKRELASFESYFLFNDILDRYWSENISDDERLFYYPIYLWWKITAIIPERPKEFILTPRDCLTIKNNKFILKLRKDKLKGRKKPVSYRIKDDFYIFEFQIPNKLAKEIQWYIDKTSEDSDLNTLFVMNTHYSQFGKTPGTRNRFLTRANLNTILRYFYTNIVQNKYGYEIIYDINKKYLKPNQIQYMHLSDTRHLALINIIAEGGTPIVAMQLGGHSNIEITMHYASNIAKLVECKTYRYLKGISGYTISKPVQIPMIRTYTKVGNVTCCSTKIKNNDYSDCINAVSEEGKIGDCNSCPFSVNSIQSNNPRDNIEKNVQFLIDTLNRFKRNDSDFVDILNAFSSISTSAYTYKQYLIEKEKNNG